MNLRDLAYLVAAAETEHFGQAAARCHVSQPTLSGQIRKLEDTLGVALFERSHRTVVLTDVGRDISIHARGILDQVRQLQAVAQSRQNPLAGDIRIGIIPTLCAYLLPHLIQPLRDRYPDLQPSFFEEPTDVLLQRLRTHQIDAAVLATEHGDDDLNSSDLFDEPLLLALAPEHPLAAERAVAASALPEVPILTLADGHCLAQRVRDVLNTTSDAPQPVSDFRATSLETVLQLVAAGHGATLVPALAMLHAGRDNSRLAFRPLQSEALAYRRIRIVQRRSSSRSGALQAVADTLINLVPGMFDGITSQPVTAGPG